MTTTTNAAVTTYPVTIDYHKSLNEMVRAGKFSYVNSAITSKHFPILGAGMMPTKLILVHFDLNIESDNAVAELNRIGLEPACLEHATAFGEKYPDVQKEFPIVFIASVWTGAIGDRHVPYLDHWGDKRGLFLNCLASGWSRRYRFAAVRKFPVVL